MAITNKEFTRRLDLVNYVYSLSGSKLGALYSAYNNILKAYKANDFSSIKQNKTVYAYACNRLVMTSALIKAYANLVLMLKSYPELGTTMRHLGNNQSTFVKSRSLYKMINDVLSKHIDLEVNINIESLDKLLSSGVPPFELNVQTEEEIAEGTPDVAVDVKDADDAEDTGADGSDNAEDTLEDDLSEEEDTLENDSNDKGETKKSRLQVLESRIEEVIATRRKHAPLVLQIATHDNTKEQLHIALDKFSDDNKKLVSDMLDVAYREKDETADAPEEYIRVLAENMIQSINLVETIIFNLDKDIRRDFYYKYDRLCEAMHSKRANDKQIVQDNLNVYYNICNKKAVMALIAPITPSKFEKDFGSLYNRLSTKDEGSQLKNANALANDFDDFIKKYNGQGVNKDITYDGIISSLSKFNDSADDTEEVKKVKAEGRIKALLEKFNSIANKSKPLINEVVLPTAFAVLCDKIENVKFDDNKELDSYTEDTFVKTMTSSLVNQLIDNDSLGLRLALEDMAEETNEKFSISIDENIINKLNEHKQLEYVLSKMFKYNVDDGSAKDLGAKALIAIVCSSVQYAVKNMKDVKKEGGNSAI